MPESTKYTNRIAKFELNMEGIDWRWALIYLAMTITPKERHDSGIREIIPISKRTRGSKATILTSEVDEVRERWSYPTAPKNLSVYQKKRVLGCVVQQMVKLIFNTHVYEFNGVIYLQTEGGPMGLRSSGPLSRLFMDQ